MDFLLKNNNTITTVLSVVINSFFIYLVMFKSRTGMGGYREVLAATGFFEIFYSLLIIVSNQLLYISPDVYLVYMTPGAFFDNSFITIHIMAIKISCITLTYGILEVHFIYRYIAICKPHSMKNLSKTSWKIYLTIYIFFHGLIVYLVLSQLLYCDEDTRTNFEADFLKKTGLRIYDRAMICMTFTKGSDMVILRSYIADFLLFSISLYLTSVYFILGFLIVHYVISSPNRDSLANYFNDFLTHYFRRFSTFCIKGSIKLIG
ncbi:unnamed protein product [Caenorhabditis angaria]|uniref:7TM GPCR serpentine receptor class x (Srx) domain-containing protein n=1 Tax=Caenorhabditis angaria TaxID=860376 RepID=A0A9P1N990_9PELO|nr:unnamed protein product [Caenorhabditis angaria]